MPLANARRRMQDADHSQEPSEHAYTGDDNDVVELTVDVEVVPVFVQPDARYQFVRILRGQVGIYAQGSVVPTAAFPDIQRLIGLGVVGYDSEATEPTPIDHNAALAAGLSRPLSLPGATIPHAPWVSSTAGDILGPAIARQVNTFSEPFPMLQTITVPDTYGEDHGSSNRP